MEIKGYKIDYRLVNGRYATTITTPNKIVFQMVCKNQSVEELYKEVENFNFSENIYRRDSQLKGVPAKQIEENLERVKDEEYEMKYHLRNKPILLN